MLARMLDIQAQCGVLRRRFFAALAVWAPNIHCGPKEGPVGDGDDGRVDERGADRDHQLRGPTTGAAVPVELVIAVTVPRGPVLCAA